MPPVGAASVSSPPRRVPRNGASASGAGMKAVPAMAEPPRNRKLMARGTFAARPTRVGEFELGVGMAGAEGRKRDEENLRKPHAAREVRRRA